jgi:hypothetical protein
MTDFVTVVGIVTISLVMLLVAIPVLVGAVQFWIYYIRILRKTRKEEREKAASEQVPNFARK